jgi:LmbE family N-acetylglucosaminyl deacetylase
MITLVAATILAIGAHAGDAELTTGAVILKETQRGNRATILHLTLGEAGNRNMSAVDYGAQKRREATEVAAALGAEVLFGPYKDGELPNDSEARRYVANIIRKVKPTLILTHWKLSDHQDHAATSAVVRDAVLLAALPSVALPESVAWRGVRSVWFAENWEDSEGFKPYVYVDVTGALPQWREAVSKYEFVGGKISSFAYLDYYTALATVRGALAFKQHAVAFNVEETSKKQVLGALP